MLIEFIGCSGTGKSTLARRVLSALSQRNCDVDYSVDLVACLTHTSWCRNERFRNLLLNGFLLGRFSRSIRNHGPFYRFAFSRIMNDGIGYANRINRMRSTMRLVCSNAILRDNEAASRLIIVDEGVIGCAHNLFVYPHSSTPPSKLEIDRFVKLSPAPDLIVHVDAPFDVVLERTLQRVDPPIKHGTLDGRYETYLRSALSVFRSIAECKGLQGRVCNVTNAEDTSDSISLLTNKIISFVKNNGKQNG